MVDRGNGLRTRALEIPATKVRFLRFGEPRGDEYYASRIRRTAKRRRPSPAMKVVVDAPLADGAAAKSMTPAAPPDRSRSVLLFVALAFAVAWLGYALFGRAGHKGEEVERWVGLSALAGSRPTTTFGSCSSRAARPLSIYEVVWFHLLRLVIGASALSVGIVLAAFMGGMFLGSLLFARYAPRGQDPVRVYAWLEVGVGVLGLAMPIALPVVKLVYIGLFGYGTLGIALRAVVAAVLLLPPTALMGATLPAIARRYSEGRRGMRTSQACSGNTLGAVLGCLLSAFYLLAVWDVWVATATAAAINFTIGAVGLRLARLGATQSDRYVAPVHVAAASGNGAPNPGVRLVYLAAALSGLTALGAQVVWTRLLTLLFGATVLRLPSSWRCSWRVWASAAHWLPACCDEAKMRSGASPGARSP